MESVRIAATRCRASVPDWGCEGESGMPASAFTCSTVCGWSDDACSANHLSITNALPDTGDRNRSACWSARQSKPGQAPSRRPDGRSYCPPCHTVPPQLRCRAGSPAASIDPERVFYLAGAFSRSRIESERQAFPRTFMHIGQFVCKPHYPDHAFNCSRLAGIRDPGQRSALLLRQISRSGIDHQFPAHRGIERGVCQPPPHRWCAMSLRAASRAFIAEISPPPTPA